VNDDDDELLARAQRKLEARREAWQREQAAAAPQRFAPPRELGPVRPAPRILKRPGMQRTASTEQALSMQKPGLMYVVPPPLPEASAESIERRVRETIPEAFRDVTWDSLATLQNPEGGPSLGAVETESGALLRGAAAVHEARRRIVGARKVVIFGPTRAGKTLLAMAALEDELRSGNDRARWVHAPALREADAMARALSSSFLVLDDLGYELDGAPDGSGWLAQKRGPACEFLGRWYLRRDARLVVTTWLGTGQMYAAYGEGATARVYEGAAVIKLHKE
jgi:hypothetical protein